MSTLFYPAKAEEARWIERKNAVILLNPRTGRYCRLNSVAAHLWRICDGTMTAEEAAAAIAEGYHVSRSRARRDVFSLLDRLRGDGLVKFFRTSKRFYPHTGPLTGKNEK